MNRTEDLTTFGKFAHGVTSSAVAVTAMNPVFGVAARQMAARKQAGSPLDARTPTLWNKLNPVTLWKEATRGLKPNLASIVPGQSTALFVHGVAHNALTSWQGSPATDLQTLGCGMLAGNVAGLMTNPLERMRTVEQVRKVSSREAFKLMRSEGAVGLVRGSPYIMAREMIFQGGFFGGEAPWKRLWRKAVPQENVADTLAYTTNGAVSAFLSTPAERLRVLAHNQTGKLPFVQTVTALVKEEGVTKALFKGGLPRTLLGGGFLAVLGKAKEVIPNHLPSWLFNKK
jgi:hypothetical protein